VQDKLARFTNSHEEGQAQNKKIVSRYKKEEVHKHSEELERDYQEADRSKEASSRKLKAPEEAASIVRENRMEKKRKQKQIEVFRIEKEELHRKIREQEFQTQKDKRGAARRRQDDVEQ
jgi:hypothetical protein